MGCNACSRSDASKTIGLFSVLNLLIQAHLLYKKRVLSSMILDLFTRSAGACK